MLNSIQPYLPLIGVIVGAILTSLWALFLSKRTDKRKLKKLLFHLLELRHQLGREAMIHKTILHVKPQLMTRLIRQFDEEFEISDEDFLTMMQRMMPKNISDENRLSQLEAIIDQVIFEIAEIYPLFAYELSGRYQIKERLAHVNQVSEILHEMPFDYKAFIEPKMNEKMAIDLDKNIRKIARKIGFICARQTSKVLLLSEEVDIKDIEPFLDEYVQKIKEVVLSQQAIGVTPHS